MCVVGLWRARGSCSTHRHSSQQSKGRRGEYTRNNEGQRAGGHGFGLRAVEARKQPRPAACATRQRHSRQVTILCPPTATPHMLPYPARG